MHITHAAFEEATKAVPRTRAAPLSQRLLLSLHQIERRRITLKRIGVCLSIRSQYHLPDLHTDGLGSLQLPPEFSPSSCYIGLVTQIVDESLSSAFH